MSPADRRQGRIRRSGRQHRSGRNVDIANGVDVILTGEVDGHMIDSMADAKPVLKTPPRRAEHPRTLGSPCEVGDYAAVTSVATVLGETRLPGTSPMMTRARRESYIGG